MLLRMDTILEVFERDASEFAGSSDATILEGVQRVVRALNVLNDDYEGAAIETSERDLLCAYIDEVITEAGVDLDSLSARTGIPRDEITDSWRTW